MYISMYIYIYTYIYTYMYIYILERGTCSTPARSRPPASEGAA